MIDTRIKALREKENISQKELAKNLGVSSSTIAMYETGKRNPDSDMLKRIGDYFNVSVDYLLGRTDSPTLQIIEYTDKELGHIEIGMEDYPYHLTPKEVEEMIETLKKYHFNVDALIDDMRNKNTKK